MFFSIALILIFFLRTLFSIPCFWKPQFTMISNIRYLIAVDIRFKFVYFCSLQLAKLFSEETPFIFIRCFLWFAPNTLIKRIYLILHSKSWAVIKSLFLHFNAKSKKGKLKKIIQRKSCWDLLPVDHYQRSSCKYHIFPTPKTPNCASWVAWSKDNTLGNWCIFLISPG